MARMEIPPHIPASAERFSRLFSRIIARGGIRSVTLGIEPGCPRSSWTYAGMTRVPFLLVCIKGAVRIAVMRDGRPEKMVLHERHAVFMGANTWIRCDHYDAALYVRITMDEDHTLFGMDEKVYDRDTVKLGDQELRLYACPRLPDRTVTALVRRLEAPPRTVHAHAWAVHAVNLLLVELARLLEGHDEVRSGGKARGTWLAVRGYLDQHCDMALERADVARAFGVTPGHISRLLKRFGNAGFAGALRQMRLARARMLLESSRLTVSEIAYRCGFSSPTYFVRVFRRDGGVPPGEYRRRVAAAGCMEL